MSRILVVDDDPHVARTLVDLLALHGYQSTRAESGEQALEVLEREPFDLVILDVRLPGMSGFETCGRIREIHGASLPVIMLTALGDAGSLRSGYEAGTDDFLQKPVDTPALILKVRAFLRLKALHDETVRLREEDQGRARDLALLHEIGRDWSLIAEPEEFNRMVTSRLATLIGAPICLIARYDPTTRTMSAALPAHGLSDDVARRIRYEVKPDHGALWDFRAGRPYVSQKTRSDPPLIQAIVETVDAESVVLVPMLSEGSVLGLLVAVDKPGGFTDADVQLLSIFAGPAASFIRSRQIFGRERLHASRLERVAGLVGEMGATLGRPALLGLATSRIQSDLGYDRVAFHGSYEGTLRKEAECVGRVDPLPTADLGLLLWAFKGSRPTQLTLGDEASVLAVPVRAGELALGVLEVVRSPKAPFLDEEVNLLSTLAGQMAVTLQKAESVAETERLAAQMATLYDLGLETGVLRDLRLLFVKATEEAGRLIRADHASVFRLDEAEDLLRLFVAWAADPTKESYAAPVFRVGEGIAGRVARDRNPAIMNDAEERTDFVERSNPVSRLLCVPLLYYDQERQDSRLFGVLNATRLPGSPSFTHDDLEYLTRFAGQLSIAVANSVAFAAERQRSEQLSLVNTLIREIAGSLSRERVLNTAVRRIHEAFRYPVVQIVESDTPSGLHRIVAEASSEPRTPSWGQPREVTAGIVGKALRGRITVLVPDVLTEPDYVAMVPSTRSEVAVPIVSGDEVVAVLNVESDVKNAFDRGHVMTLETLADGVGIILRNAELYQAREATNAKLVELDRMKSELVNIVAHDFRAPLAGVLGHAELLEWRPDAPLDERQEQARAIIEAATHMAHLVDKTLKTSRMETGQFPFEFGIVDLAATVREVVDRLPQAERHPVRLDVPDAPVPCWADPDRIREVLENLVSNAIKYSPDGGEIGVQLQCHQQAATVTVLDQGVGIAPENIGRLFKPFSRVRDRRTADIHGSGLGLYICERIVKAHGGRTWVTSKPGEGSSFSFTLPVYGAEARDRAPLILVATGDERTRREVRRVAEEKGYATHEVMDGVEAVEAALRLVPVAAVLDRVLPRLGAEQVAERLRENVSTESVHVIVLADDEELGERETPFDACLSRPFDPVALVAVLEEVSSRRHEVP
jgi:signal transduction histidine kinase/DNA-binding response OmpR family regulator